MAVRLALRVRGYGYLLQHRTLYSTPVSAVKIPDMVPRAGGIATMLRLPYLPGGRRECKDLDACFVGIPLDTGASNRSGTRHGPRAVRDASCRISARCHLATGALPYESLRVADIGDVPLNPFNLLQTVDIIAEYYDDVLSTDCIPLCIGGDHTITLPILRAMRKKHGPVGLVHVDAHLDFHDSMFGEKINHGSTFKRALEEGLVSPKHMVQIGIRQLTNKEDFEGEVMWAKRQGVRIVCVEECWYKSLVPLMKTVREQMGGMPVYLSFDIDGIDPAYCPGTGTPEIGGLMVSQGIEIIRGCKGLNLVGADLVEVNPLLDTSAAITSVNASSLLFEMLCVLPGVKYLPELEHNNN